MKKLKLSFIFLCLLLLSITAHSGNIGIQGSQSFSDFFKMNDNFPRTFVDISLNVDLFEKFNFGISLISSLDNNSNTFFSYDDINKEYIPYTYESAIISIFTAYKKKLCKNIYFFPYITIGMRVFEYDNWSNGNGTYKKEDNEYKLDEQKVFSFHKQFFYASAGINIKYFIPYTNFYTGLKSEITYDLSDEKDAFIVITGIYLGVNILK
ncbi:MAG: hypothetical protein ACTSXH_15895 [Promethearchaeota archaeon]